MTKATVKPGPVPANPYAVIVLVGGFDIERFNYPDPMDALIGAVRYLREGRQVRLTDRTVSALREVESLAILDKLITALAPDVTPTGLVQTGPPRPADGVPFIPPVSASGA